MARSARALLGGDVEIRGEPAAVPRRPPRSSRASPDGWRRRACASWRHGAGGRRRAADVLVELKASSPRYPFYGRLVAEPDRPLASLIGRRRRPRAARRSSRGSAAGSATASVIGDADPHDQRRHCPGAGPRRRASSRSGRASSWPRRPRPHRARSGSAAACGTGRCSACPRGGTPAAFRAQLAAPDPRPAVRVPTYAEAQPVPPLLGPARDVPRPDRARRPAWSAASAWR